MKRSSDLISVPFDKQGRAIRAMFGSIAPRYDLLNHLLSANIDRHWRRLAVRQVERALGGKDGLLLDLCTGTADLAIGLSKLGPVVGCDFCHPMLEIGTRKIQSLGLGRKVLLTEGDALQLPFGDNRFAAVTIAFGLRNLEDVRTGLGEIYRVLRPDGVAAILEFSHPSWPVFRSIYSIYFTRVLPWIGRLVSGQSQPYSYLPQSVREFPDKKTLRTMMESTGFQGVVFDSLTGGVAALHVGRKTERALSRERQRAGS